MTSPSPDSDALDLALLKEAALAVGPLLRETFQTKVKTWSKGAAGPVTEIDLAVDAMLKERLIGARPDYGWLSEESVDDEERLSRTRVFIVDPIDGTTAFIKGTPDFCVSLALVADARPVAGVVYNPITDELVEARRGGGAYLNGMRVSATDKSSIEGARMVGRAGFFTDARWPTPWPALHAEHRIALAYRLALVAAGQFDAMISLGYKHEWDVAAGALLVSEAGGHATDPWGGALAFNQKDTRTPGMVAAGPLLHPLLIERVRFSAHPGAPRPSDT